MELYFRNDPTAQAAENLGNPSLLYTGYIGEKMSEHPRSIHAHHNSVELLLMLDGPAEITVDGTTYEVDKYDLLIYNSDVLHDEVPHGGPQRSVIYCAATGIQIEGLPPNHLMPGTVEPILRLGPKGRNFKYLLQSLFDESYRDNSRSHAICQLLFLAILKMTLNELESSRVASAVPETHQLGERIKAYVNAHYLEPITTQSVADVFGISVSYLSHLYKKATGQTIVQYVMRRRIGEAQTLLIATNKKVSDIAGLVGYPNVSYFNTLFTRNVGMPPLKYRKTYRNIESQNW